MNSELSENEVETVLNWCQRVGVKDSYDYHEFVNMAIVKPATVHQAVEKIYKAAGILHECYRYQRVTSFVKHLFLMISIAFLVYSSIRKEGENARFGKAHCEIQCRCRWID